MLCHDFFLGWSQQGTFSSRRSSLGRSTVLKYKIHTQKRKTIYLLNIENTVSRKPLKNGERKTYKVYFLLYVPFATQTVEEQFPHLIPSLSSVKAGDNKCRQIECLTATIKNRNTTRPLKVPYFCTVCKTFAISKTKTLLLVIFIFHVMLTKDIGRMSLDWHLLYVFF